MRTRERNVFFSEGRRSHQQGICDPDGTLSFNEGKTEDKHLLINLEAKMILILFVGIQLARSRSESGEGELGSETIPSTYLVQVRKDYLEFQVSR